MKAIIPPNRRILTVPLILGHTNKVTTSRRAQVLGVHVDADGTLILSVAGNPDADRWDDRLFVVRTDALSLPHELGRPALVGGPIMCGDDVWYVFEIDSPEDGPRLGTKRGAASVIVQQNAPVPGVSVQVGQMLGHVGGLAGPGVYVQ